MLINGKISASYLQNQQQQQKIVDMKPNMAVDQHCINSVNQRQNFRLISMKLTTTTKIADLKPTMAVD